jgi:LPS-assembly lipoprotein
MTTVNRATQSASTSTSQHWIVRWWCVLLLIGLTSSCGFTLRGQQLPTSVLSHLHVEQPASFSALHDSVERFFTQQGIKSDIDGTITHTITIKPEAIERRLLSVFSTGQVAEYELIYAVNYALNLADSEPTNYTFTLIREYQDDPRQVLAKTRELNLVLNELRQEAAATIYQRLPAHLAQLQGR